MKNDLVAATLIDRIYKVCVSIAFNAISNGLICTLIWLLSKAPSLTPEFSWRSHMGFALAKYGFRLDKANHGKASNDLALRLARLLNEPQSKVRRLLASHCAHISFAKLIDRSSGRNSEYRKKLLVACKWQNENDYTEKYRCTSRSAVYVTIHMGYTEAMFLRVFSSSPEKKYSIIVRSINNKQAFENSSRFVREIGLDVSMIETFDSKSIISAIKRLRRGVLSLGVYCDLPKSFGKSERISFLDKEAEIVVGPAKIAILGRVPIIPVFCFTKNNIPHIEMHDPIYTHRLLRESVDEAAKRITQSIHKVSEQVIRRYPEQWMYLNKIQSFYPSYEEGL
jgi:lauroyl/myristoyl acyltransferase